MSKILVAIDVPDSCYEMEIESTCSCYDKTHIHFMGLQADDIATRRRAYEILKEQLEVLGITEGEG